jgi:hypothetical protein
MVNLNLISVSQYQNQYQYVTDDGSNCTYLCRAALETEKGNIRIALGFKNGYVRFSLSLKKGNI